jgi:hypothetical protein
MHLVGYFMSLYLKLANMAGLRFTKPCTRINLWCIAHHNYNLKTKPRNTECCTFHDKTLALCKTPGEWDMHTETLLQPFKTLPYRFKNPYPYYNINYSRQFTGPSPQTTWTTALLYEISIPVLLSCVSVNIADTSRNWTFYGTHIYCHINWQHKVFGPGMRWRRHFFTVTTNMDGFLSLSLSLTHARTHTHTHIFIYFAGWNLVTLSTAHTTWVQEDDARKCLRVLRTHFFVVAATKYVFELANALKNL